MTTTAVRDRVRDDFGLDVETLEPVTAHATARLWRATAGACRYAVRWTSATTPAAQVALALARTIPQRPQDVLPAPAALAPPLLTRAGAAEADHDGGRLSVAPWLDGPTGRDVALTPPQWTAFGRLVARLHALDPASVPGLARESFDPTAAVGRALDVDLAVTRALHGTTDEVGEATAAAWVAARPRVAAVRARAVRVGHRLREQGRDVPLVVTHADAHVGHVIATGPRDVALLDWGHACVAPPESDLLFVLGGVLPHAPVTVEQSAAFFTGYGRVDIDDDRLAYARCVRALHDLTVAAGGGLDPDAPVAVRAEALGDLTAHLGPGGVVAAALE
ncbi:phosphotransferase [Cellulomonas persica]|uniref:phosphotransferase n=1 Tax=Cellulomonas persica TaxID=76861 RepID=UPI001649DEBF|nr:phosphotransferase [Cellulomonas persica]